METPGIPLTPVSSDGHPELAALAAAKDRVDELDLDRPAERALVHFLDIADGAEAEGRGDLARFLGLGRRAEADVLGRGLARLGAADELERDDVAFDGIAPGLALSPDPGLELLERVRAGRLFRR